MPALLAKEHQSYSDRKEMMVLVYYYCEALGSQHLPFEVVAKVVALFEG